MSKRGVLVSLSFDEVFVPMVAVLAMGILREDALVYARSNAVGAHYHIGMVFLPEGGFAESWGSFALGGPQHESNEFSAWLLELVKDEWGKTEAEVRDWFTDDGGHSWPREECVSPANLIAECADLRAKVKEIEEQRDAAVFVSKQLTAVLVTAGAPEFSSAQHAHDWATETAKLRAEVADCRQILHVSAEENDDLRDKLKNLEADALRGAKMLADNATAWKERAEKAEARVAYVAKNYCNAIHYCCRVDGDQWNSDFYGTLDRTMARDAARGGSPK